MFSLNFERKDMQEGLKVCWKCVGHRECSMPMMFQKRAWALRGRKAERKWFFVRGRRYSLLPALTVDELAFSAIKAYVQRAGVLGRDRFDVDDDEVYVHLYEAAHSVTADSAKGWFHHCGYL
ncbi:hypothetical protein DFH05DRAFT_1020918 [Lentinula detonsa]|uniref:Uncharacterized protein n=1 Tax=Lentinula detonsa TaxID=2804962 RepID=A0A9W8TYD5_9AGAR|nr:hypothetical protein DFH05DRAFT_1020918 [Lentinula detonsa]